MPSQNIDRRTGLAVDGQSAEQVLFHHDFVQAVQNKVRCIMQSAKLL